MSQPGCAIAVQLLLKKKLQKQPPEKQKQSPEVFLQKIMKCAEGRPVL